MADLTVEQLSALRRQVGTGPTVTELQTIYDRVGTVTETAREVLELRLADLEANPTSFSIAGEYSQDTKDNIAATRRRLESLGDLDSEDTTDDGGTPQVRVHAPARRPGR